MTRLAILLVTTATAAPNSKNLSTPNAPKRQQAAPARQNALPQQAMPQQAQQQSFGNAEAVIDRKNLAPVKITVAPDDTVVQLAVLLDTSNSMDGLIAQAKQQLWMIVNELAKASKGGKPARMEVALYEYGNSGLLASDGFVRQVQPFTGDLDLISEKLFALRTNGGDEYCGHVIMSAVNRLQWNPSDENLKITYVAGNEPFTQGPIDFRDAAKDARDRDILVNTIYCGHHEEGVRTQWLAGATAAGGTYANIDQDQALVHVEAPQDEELLRLNKRLNETYVPYGADREVYAARQAVQDANAAKMHKGVLSKRIASKGSRMYTNEAWDLVDALDTKTVKLEDIEKKHLPEELRKLTTKQLREHVAAKKAERASLQKRITELSRARDKFVAEERRKLAASGTDTLEDVIIASLRRQARAKGFEFAGH